MPTGVYLHRRKPWLKKLCPCGMEFRCERKRKYRRYCSRTCPVFRDSWVRAMSDAAKAERARRRRRKWEQDIVAALRRLRREHAGEWSLTGKVLVEAMADLIQHGYLMGYNAGAHRQPRRKARAA